MKKKYVVGVDLGGTKIYTALADIEGNIIKEKIVPTEADKGDEHVLNNIINTIESVIVEVDKDQIKAIGIGSPGPLDLEKGMIVYTPNLPFKNFKIVDRIKLQFNIPTYLDNDANVATLAEYKFGAGKDCNNMLFVTVSTGIGGGAILNNKIYRGSTGNGLEVGHMTVSKEGLRCGCGNTGCAEAMASGTAITKRAREAVSSNVVTSLKNYEYVTTKEVFEEAEKGDKVSMEILDNALSYLGITISNLANIFDPDIIVIGGGVTNGGQVVFDKIAEEVNRRTLKPIYKNCKIAKAQLEGMAGVLGAVALAIME